MKIVNCAKMILIDCGVSASLRYWPVVDSLFSKCGTAKHTVWRDSSQTLCISNDMPEGGGGEGASTSVDAVASDDDDGGDAEGEPARRSSRSKKSIHPSGKHRNASTMAGAQLSLIVTPPKPQKQPQAPDIALWSCRDVLSHIPISRSSWWAGVKSGRYPAPVRISPKRVAWRASDIRALVASF